MTVFSLCASVVFVMERARARAEEKLPDRRAFSLKAQDWEKFLGALDAPIRPLPRLKTLFATPSVFERADRS